MDSVILNPQFIVLAAEIEISRCHFDCDHNHESFKDFVVVAVYVMVDSLHQDLNYPLQIDYLSFLS